jgi:dTDP-4-dehydrorhamnose 3,5-epimerase
VQVAETKIKDVWLLKPKVFRDERGFFVETYNERTFAELGIHYHFVQDNLSRSRKNVLRGLHYQIRQPQGKLIRVILGEVFDVCVDIRRGSPTFGRWVGERLSAENQNALWVPPGFAHGFLVLSDWVEVVYKTTDFYAPHYERTIRWNDSDLAIDWPVAGSPELSDKDRDAPSLAEAEVYSGALELPKAEHAGR